MTASSLSNIFPGYLINVMPFYFSWSCLLLSTATWMQVALLSQHRASNTLRAMKKAIRNVVLTPRGVLQHGWNGPYEFNIFCLPCHGLLLICL